MAGNYQSREERRKQLTGKNKAKEKKNPSSVFKKIFLFLIALGIVGMVAGAGTFAYLVKDAPKLDKSLLKDPISSKILDKDGKVFTEVGSVNRDYVNYEDIPKRVEDAFLATEDVRFYKHNGIDLIRLGGAVVANITNGFGSEGASTITQQVVKNSFLGFEKTISRKVQEAWLAYQLEQNYTKHEIFEMYVNKIFMSERSHGVATAAKIYFGKDLKDLELHEAALLAGMPQSPNNYNPFTNPERAEKRRNIVLYLMNKHGFISKEEMKKAQDTPVESTLVPEEKRNVNDKPFDAFVDVVIEEVEKYGDFDIFSDGLTIHTTLDPKAQTYVEKMLNSNEIVNFPDKEFQAGITLLDTKTGEIRAIGGGRNQEVKRGFNYATDIKRQPGSTIKPILDYGPAIEYLKWGTYHMLEDKEMTYSDNKKTTFGNWNDKFEGNMTIRRALAKSKNTIAVQALEEVGLERAKDFAVKLGIPLKEIYPSYAIGGFGGKTVGISPMQLAGAYSAFGNNGFYTKPYAVKKIQLRDKTMIDTSPETEVVMKDYTAFMITDMLKSVLDYGTGTMARVPGLPIAGKTGTTNYSEDDMQKFGITDEKAVPDAWFAGYTTNYTAAIWTGYKNKSTPIPGGPDQKIAQALFKNLMAYVSQDVKTPDFSVPKSVEKVRIEKYSVPAKLASEYTPDSQVLYEYAVRGNAPRKVSQKYDKLSSPFNASAVYDEANNEIVLTWDHKADSGVQFEVNVSLDEGGEQKVSTTSERGLKLTNPIEGGIYNFSIIAISGDERSDAAKATVEIPAAFIPEEQLEEDDSTNDDDATEEEPAEPVEEDNTGTEKEKEKDKEKEKENKDKKQDDDTTGAVQKPGTKPTTPSKPGTGTTPPNPGGTGDGSGETDDPEDDSSGG